jgi:hypothetical protein
MKIQIDLDAEGGYIEYICEMMQSDTTSTFGGEADLDGYDIKEYGLNIGDISIHSISPEQFKHLAVNMINHLMNNGHNFVIDRDYNGYFVKDITR